LDIPSYLFLCTIKSRSV